MRPLGGRVRNPTWSAYASDDLVIWFNGFHGDWNVRARVLAHFLHAIDKIELDGPHAGTKWVEKLNGKEYRGLGKVNYNDQVGAVRFFFKFGTLNGRRVAIFADADIKTRDDFPPERYSRALRIVEAYMTENGVKEASVW